MPKITLPMVLELIEAQEWGPTTPKIPYTAAKERLAHITAAKAVALALTPGLDPIKVRVEPYRVVLVAHTFQGLDRFPRGTMCSTLAWTHQHVSKGLS